MDRDKLLLEMMRETSRIGMHSVCLGRNQVTYSGKSDAHLDKGSGGGDRGLEVYPKIKQHCEFERPRRWLEPLLLST
jgi:hypothetical protein